MSRLERVLIVGGGSSGWMTAALLRVRLPQTTKVTLIEASDIPVIGVGESTNPVMLHFQSCINGDEKTMMRASNASYKVAIRYEDFAKKGSYYFHPFGAHRWATPDTQFKPNAQTIAPSYFVADQNNKFAKEVYPYSFHIDAGLYGQYLKELHCKPLGVEHILDKIIGVTLDEGGAIAAVKTEKSGDLTADLYIDCSGFRSMLLEGALKEPFTSVNKYLPNDRAVATRMPYVDKDAELHPYTNCTALTSGWVWNIPLYSRIGTGLVYSSAFQSKNDAEAELRRHLGEDRVKDLAFNHIEIKNGRHDRAWVKNCVAIGISYAFLEPLESTGLSLTQIGILDLADALKNGTYGSAERTAYNRRIGNFFDNTRDFIAAHYVLTSREDTPYWRFIRNEVEISDRLAAIFNEARRGSVDILRAEKDEFYSHVNWNFILSGMGMFDHGLSSNMGGYVPPQPEGEWPKHTVTTQPYSHAEFLKQSIFDGEYTPVEPPATKSGQAPMTWMATG